MASVEEVLSTMTAADVLGVETSVEYVIDNELRIITVPSNGVVLGVEGDKDVNTIHFKMPRYYRGLDLGTDFAIRINYANASKELGYFAVARPDVTEDSITFEWLVGSHAMAYVGNIQFAVTLIQSSVDGRIEKKFNTTIGTANCLTGLDVDISVPEEDVYDLLTQIKNDVMTDIQPSLDSVKSDATAAAASASSASSAQKAAEAAKNAALTSQNASAQSATDANAAKVAAESARDNASASATTAGESATLAQNAKDASEAAQKKAETSAASAAQSASEATVAQQAAETAQQAAQTSETNAQTAQQAAETAQTNAETARTAAQTAQTASETAQSKAELAQQKSEIAQAASETAQKAAETAKTSEDSVAKLIEGFSVTQGNVLTNSTQSSEIVAHDAWPAPMIGAKIFGKSEQETEPAPSLENPQSITNLTKADIRVSGADTGKYATTLIDLQGHELCSLPNGVKDELVVDDEGNVSLIKRTGEAVWNCSAVHTGTNKNYALSVKDNTPNIGANYTPLLAEKAISNSNGQIGTCYVNGANIYIVVSSDITTKEAADELYGGMKVIYTLAEPQTITLGKIEMPELPETTSNVWLDSNIKTDMEMTYVQDVNIAKRDWINYTAPIFDKNAGRYNNESVRRWLEGKRDGLCYGIMYPKSNITELTKIAANGGVAIPTPGKIGTPAIDPYKSIGGPFFYIEVNGGCDPSGDPYIVAIDGDGNYKRNHADEDTCILTPVLYTMENETSIATYTYISDTWQPGYKPEAGAILPDGTLRPYMLRAKYPLSRDSKGRLRSTSGLPPLVRTVSHDSMISMMDVKNTGYSGKTQNDEWYLKIMISMKYATKNSQKYFSGCTGHTEQFRPTIAEQNVTRVIVEKTYADKMIVGSIMMFGTNSTGNNDRSVAANYDIFENGKISKIEPYDDNNSAIYFSGIEPFSTETTYLLSTFHWLCGACNSVSGDGSPTNPTNSREPFVVQGIELGHGIYEVLGNVILSNSDASGWKVYINPDSQKEAKSVTDDYIDTGVKYDGGNSDNWKYPQYPKTVNGMMLPFGTGASTSTGLCDGLYLNKNETIGTRQWLSLGYLGVGSGAGLWCAGCGNGLGGAGWDIGSRRSYIGRTKG